MLPLAGAAIAKRDVRLSVLGGLGLVAAAFHLYAYISNDVADLRLDSTEPLRSDSPLVRGLIRPPVALAVALVQIPIAFGVLALVAGASAAVPLAVAMALMAAYNVFGKQLSFALLSDAVQGLGWVALALAGSVSTGVPLEATTLAFAALVFLYVLLINGVHGGLRDLENDRRCGASTTAIYFGAYVDERGALVLPPAMIAYAFVLQAGMGAISIAAVTSQMGTVGSAPVWAAVTVVAGTHIVLLWLLWRTLAATGRRSAMIRNGIIHLLVSLGTLILPFAWLMNAGPATVVAAAYAVPVAVMCLHDGVTWECK
jgi:4-hydroxybenzoate polyprenyltransferase